MKTIVKDALIGATAIAAIIGVAATLTAPAQADATGARTELGYSLALLQAFPVLSVHGQDNGLCQAESAELTADHYAHVAPGRYRYHVVSEHGHQDCLIGRHAATKVFPVIIDFLREGAADA